MPALGVAQQTGILLKWLKAEGQSVAKGEPLMEIETDKSIVEIEAGASGILARVTAKAGDEIPVGQAIALILVPGESMPKKASPIVATVLPSLPHGEGSAKTTSTSMSAITTAAQAGRILASPKAKRIAKEHSIDLSSLIPSGPEGSI